MDAYIKPVRDVVRRLMPRMALVWLLMPLTFVVPWLNSTAPPYFDLTGWVGEVAYRLSVSGGSRQGPLIVIFLMLLVVSRPGFSVKRRVAELLTMGMTILVLLSGGSAFNEYVIKPAFGIPRPQIIALARASADSTQEHFLLGITEDSLYIMAPRDRRDYLRKISGFDSLGTSLYEYCFEQYDAYPELHLRKDVCGHWASTSQGFSFPSGHAYSAMFLATFFWGLAMSLLAGWRLAFFQYLVVPWTVLVAYSRVVLRVHSPLDITVGGLLGILMGLAAFLLVRKVLWKEKVP